MKTLRKRHERRGTLLATQALSTDMLKRLYKRMWDATTAQGEMRLIRTLCTR